MAEIVFDAAVYKVQTLVDGGVRVTLDLPETAIPQMAMLAECQRNKIPLTFRATAIDTKTLTKLDDETKTGAEKRTSRVGRRRS
jgi:hypothetical protein